EGCVPFSIKEIGQEQLKDFLPRSIILNCELIDCDKPLSHRPSSQDAEKNASPYPDKASLAPSLVMTPGKAGPGLHLAEPGSDFRNHMELVEHPTPASALSGGEEAKGKRGSAGERCANG
ncbi:hypothetical protein NQZ68_032062, partial [Dissostichus eleginoides]